MNKLEEIRGWIKNEKLISFLMRKGIDVNFTRNYYFNKVPSESQINLDYITVSPYVSEYKGQIVKSLK